MRALKLDELDLIIRNANIVDGCGRPLYGGSIGVFGDKVVAVGSVKGDAKNEVDASGLTAIPGIIDAHSHVDRHLQFMPEMESYLLQGVTTFIGGQCGHSLAPIRDGLPLRNIWTIVDVLDEIIPYKYYPQERVPVPLEKLNPLMEKHFGWSVGWRTMAEYFKAIEDLGISCNFVPLVGHGTCRSVVLGEDFKRPSTPSELEEIKALLRSGLDDGCMGMSLGLDYDPGVYSDRNELVECVSLLREYGGVLCAHSRRTGRRRNIAAGTPPHHKIDGIREVVDICRAADVRMNISHLYTGWYITPGGGPSILEEANRKATLMVIDEALEEGLDISFDVIPSSLMTRFGGWRYLCSTFAPWVREKGSKEAFAEGLKVPEYREEIKDAIRRGEWYIAGPNPYTNSSWARGLAILRHGNPGCEGKTVQQIADERGTDPFEAWFDLIVEDPDSKIGIGRGNPMAPYNAIFFQHPTSMVGTDTLNGDDYKWAYKTIERGPVPGISNYSAYVGFFDKFVKWMKALTLEEAVYKTSTYVAKRHNLMGRGVIKEGCYADIVLMDFDNLKVMGTPLEPRVQPRGIEYVFVNGVTVVEKARHTGTRPGRVIKREL